MNYLRLDGRATRREFLAYSTFRIVSAIIIGIADEAIFGKYGLATLTTAWAIVFIYPDIAILVRRLHDVNLSGWWLLTIPTIVGGFFVMALSLSSGDPHYNRYGPA